MTDEYYVASAAESGWTSDSSNEYNKRMARSRRVLSKFNDEQKRTAWQNIKSTSIVLMGVNLVDRTVTRTFDRLQSVINKFTYAPLMEGLSEYTDQLTEFQAIVQNSAQWFDNIGGADHIQAITDALDDLNSYADLTIYKFRDMQRSFTGFVNAGLTVKDSATMAKGIASWTAFMGKGAYDYASAAYMMNQALLAGKMQYYQWRSLEQFSQIGGMLPKKLFIETAKSLGKDAPDWEELANPYDEEETDQNFRDSLADDWLTSSVMLKAMDILANFGSEYDEAKLKAQGFSDEVINMAKNAFGESQKVRTYSQFMDAVIESIGTGWGQIFRSFLGDTTVATKMWTKLMLQVTGDIDGVVESVKKQAENFAKAGGRDAIEGILFNIWDIIKNITKSVSNLFRIAIPSTNNLGASLANVAKNIEWFTGLLAGKNKIKNQFSFLGVLAAISEKVYNVIKRLFGIVRKLWDQGLKPIFSALGQFVLGLGPQVWGIIDKLVGKLEAFADMLINSGLFSSIANIFTGTSNAISSGIEEGGIVGFIKALIQNISDAIKGVNLDGMLGGIKDMIEAFTGIVSGDGISNLFKIVWIAFQMKAGLKAIAKVFESIAEIAEEFDGVETSFSKIVGSILAVTISIAIIASVDLSKLWDASEKALLVGFIMRRLGGGLEAIAENSYRIWALIPLMIGIAAIIGGLVYFIYRLKKAGADLSDLTDILYSIGNVIAKISWLLTALSALLFILSTKAIVTKIIADKTKQNTDQMAETFKQLFKKGKFQLNLQLGDYITKRLVGTAAVIAAILGYIKSVGELILELANLTEDPKKYWAGLGGFMAIMLALGVFLGMITKFAYSKQWNDFQTLRHGKQKISKGSSSQNVAYLWGMAFLILAIGGAVWSIAKAVEKVGKMDPNQVFQGASVVGAIALGLYMMAYNLQKISNASYNFKFNFSMISTIIAMEVILANILGIAALCWWIGGWDTDKLKQGGIVVGVIAAALIGIAWSLGALNNFLAKSMNKAGSFKTILSFAAVLFAFAMVLASISLVLAEIIAVSEYIGSKDDAYKNMWKAYGVFAAVAAVILGMYFLITLINSKLKNQNDVLNMAVTLGLLSVMIIAISVLLAEIALIANGPIGKMFAAAGVLAIIALVVVGIYAALSLIASKSGGSFGKIMLSLLAVIVIIGVLSYVVTALATLMDSGDGGKLIGMVGSIVLLVAAIAAIAVVLGILQTATMGIGAVAIWAGIAALAAIAGVVWILSDASAKFMSATGDLADGINDLVDAFRAIGDINFKTFKSNLSKFLDAIESALPRIQKLAAAVGGIAGTLIIAGGDITIGAGSVSIPSGAVAGANVGINTGSVNMINSEKTNVPVSSQDKIVSGISSTQSSGNKVENNVAGFFGGLFKGIGLAVPKVLEGLVTGGDSLKETLKAVGLQDRLDEVDTTGWAEEDIKKLESIQNQHSTGPGAGKYKKETQAYLEKKYPDSFKKKNGTVNVGDLSSVVPVDDMFNSKYSWLDDKVLNGVSKNQLTNDLDNMYDDINEAIKATGTIDEATIKAIVKAYVESSQYSDIYISGNMLGDITNRVLGQYIN